MRNIHELLKECGIEVPVDKKAEFDKALLENYKTAADYDKQSGKLTALTEQLKTATEGLKAFEGVDVNDLKGQIAKLTGDLTAKDTEYQKKIADMEFDGLLSSAIAAAKGKNANAIIGTLAKQMDALKASKNQSEDIKAALTALKESDAYLFEDESTPPPYAGGTGTHQVNTKYSPEINAIRGAAGLKTE